MSIHSRCFRLSLAALAALTVFQLAACHNSAANHPQESAGLPPFQPVGTLEEVMHGMVIPNAEVVWKSTGSIVTVKGTEEFRPKTEDDWIRVEASAVTIAEAGNLLMMEGRAKDKEKWFERCRTLVAAGKSVHDAAKARDAALLFTRGGDLFDACQGCHFQYRYTTKDPSTFRSH